MQRQYLSIEVTFPDGAPPPEGLKFCVEGKPDYQVGLIYTTPPFQIKEKPVSSSNVLEQLLDVAGLRFDNIAVVEISSFPDFEPKKPATLSQMREAVQEILDAGGISSLRYKGPQNFQEPSPKIPIKDDEWTIFNVGHISEVPGYFMQRSVEPSELIKVRLKDGREMSVHAAALVDENWRKSVTHWVKL